MPLRSSNAPHAHAHPHPTAHRTHAAVLGLATFAFVAAACRRTAPVPPPIEVVMRPLAAPTQVAQFTDEAGARDKVGKLAVDAPFTVELVAAEPLLQNPVAFTIDHRGRFFVAETHRYLQSVFDITQQTAWLRDDLALRTVADRRAFLLRTFAHDPTALTRTADAVRRVEDRDGDGRAETATLIFDDLRTPECGPIAGILAHGDTLFAACIPSLWRLDVDDERVCAQRLQDGFGVHIGVSGHDLHGLVLGPDARLYFTLGDRGAAFQSREGRTVDLPDTGAVFRCEPDGSDLQVFATGLRNPQELAFDRHGNLITADNDTAGQDMCRIIHVVEGGDYGWRCGYQHQPDFGLWQEEAIWRGDVDDVLPNAGHVAQGPAGLAYDPGTGLHRSLRDHFLLCDFPGGVRAFTLTPRGASFVATGDRKLVWGLWPTDVACGPDGALYVTDWVQGWQKPEKGRIYRVLDPAVRSDAAVRATAALLRAGFAQRGLAELCELLAHDDLRVRQEAHCALAERAPEPAWREAIAAASAGAQPLARRVHAAWACAIAARRHGVAAALLHMLGQDPAANVRAVAVRAHADQRGATAEQVADAVVPFLADPDPGVRLQAASALGRAPVPASASAILAALARDDGDPYLRHALVRALPIAHVLATKADLARHAERSVRRALLLALRRAGDARVAAFLADTDVDLVAAAVRAIHDVPIPAAMAQLVPMSARGDLPPTVRLRAVNACLRVGTAPAAAALAALAADAAAPQRLRTAALHALAQWGAPHPVDAVLGIWRPIEKHDAALAGAALAPHLPRLCAATDAEVVRAALAAASGLALPGLDAPARALLADRARPSALRAAALEVLTRAPTAADVAAFAELAVHGDTPTDLRGALFAQLAHRDGNPLRGAQLAPFLAPGSDSSVAQPALRVLARLPDGDAVLRDVVARIRASATPQPLALEARAALTAREDAASRALLADWPADDRDLFVGGDVARGRTLFRSRAELQCLRCHAVGGEGGPVGPALDRVGKQPPAYLLQALRAPSAVIAAGWPQGEPSAMPPGLDGFLDAFELRDLLAYLQSLR